jgi:hypothetical protein
MNSPHSYATSIKPILIDKLELFQVHQNVFQLTLDLLNDNILYLFWLFQFGEELLVHFVEQNSIENIQSKNSLKRIFLENIRNEAFQEIYQVYKTSKNIFYVLEIDGLRKSIIIKKLKNCIVFDLFKS